MGGIDSPLHVVRTSQPASITPVVAKPNPEIGYKRSVLVLESESVSNDIKTNTSRLPNMSSLTIKRLPAAGCRMMTRTKGSQYGHLHHDHQHRRALLTSPGSASASASASARPSVAPTRDVHPPPPEISAWIKDLISQPTMTLRDVVDRNRISHLLRTLPTRSGSAAGQSASGSSSKAKGLAIGDVGSDMEDGDILPHGHHLVLFQPRTTMDKLAADGSSTVGLPIPLHVTPPLSTFLY
jgi:hypothetical protein